MDRSIDQLIQLLQQTETLYDQLLQIIDEEKQAAIATETQRLTAAGIEKQAILSRLKPLDQQLTCVIQQIASGLRIPKSDLSLTKLAAYADAPQNNQIRELNKRLQSTITRVHSANEQCRQLIEHCLRLVRNKLGYFQHWTGASDVYGATGNIRGNAGGGRLLRGVV